MKKVIATILTVLLLAGVFALAETTGSSAAEENAYAPYIAPETAMLAALGEEREVNWIRVNIERRDDLFDRNDNDVDEYELAWIEDGQLWEAEVNAATGELLRIERENDRADLQALIDAAIPEGNGTYIGTDAALAALLARAGLTPEDVKYAAAWPEFDDGRVEYKAKFYVGDVEYSAEINALDGSVLEYETENLREDD